MLEIPLTPEWLVNIAAVIIALAFDWFPVLANWFNGKSDLVKRLLMIALLLAVTVVVFVLGCVAILTFPVTCTWAGGFEMLKIFLIAVTLNQSAHLLFKPTASARAKMFKKR